MEPISHLTCTHPSTPAASPTTPVPEPMSITRFPFQKSRSKWTPFSRNLARTRAASHTTQPTSPMYNCLISSTVPPEQVISLINELEVAISALLTTANHSVHPVRTPSGTKQGKKIPNPGTYTSKPRCPGVSPLRHWKTKIIRFPNDIRVSIATETTWLPSFYLF